MFNFAKKPLVTFIIEDYSSDQASKYCRRPENREFVANANIFIEESKDPLAKDNDTPIVPKNFLNYI